MNPTAAVGSAALLAALLASLFAATAPWAGLRWRHHGLVVAARRAIFAIALFTTIAVATLAYALLRDDFSIAHVAAVSSRDMLPEMKWASL